MFDFRISDLPKVAKESALVVRRRPRRTQLGHRRLQHCKIAGDKSIPGDINSPVNPNRTLVSNPLTPFTEMKPLIRLAFA